MKQNLKYIIPAILLLLGIFGVFSHRFDLTKEKDTPFLMLQLLP